MISPFRLEFETEDYAGRLVCLRTTTWVQHIVPYHPQMFGNQQTIAETLKSPDEVYAQRRANRRNLVYWKRQEIDQLNPWLKVVTKLVDSRAHPRITGMNGRQNGWIGVRLGRFGSDRD